MNELSQNQLEMVNGGIWPAFCAGYFVGTIAVKLYKKMV